MNNTIKQILSLIMFGFIVAGSHAAPIVVTPGSNAGYMYFPPTSVTSSSSGTVTGVGGVAIEKKESYYSYTVSHTASGSSCASGCIYGTFSTGAGFVTISASRPSIFTDASDNVLTNCSGVLNCTTWVNTDQQLSVRVYPACFEGDISTIGDSVCTTSTTPSGRNTFYSTALAATGKYAGKVSSRHLIAATSDFTSKKWATVEVSSGGTSYSDGTANTALMGTGGSSPAAEACTGMGSGWYVPAYSEIGLLYTNRASIGGFSSGVYWASTSFWAADAFDLNFGTGGSNARNKAETINVRCTRTYS